MNQSEILSKLNLTPCDLTKRYAAKLSNLFDLVNELEKMDGFKIELKDIKGNNEIVKELPELIRENFKYGSQFNEAEKSQWNFKCLTGEFEQWQAISLSHTNGTYNFNFPIDNVLHDVFLGMAGQKSESKANVIEPLNTILIQSSILKDFSKAVKFISKDSLRPSFQHVCIAMENYKLEIVSSDCHQLYQNEKTECSQKERMEILINEKAAKAISAIKTKDEVIEIHILPESKIQIEGQIFDTFNARYADYRCVVPTYKKYMSFDKADFTSNVKKVLPYANKSTAQVTFHLNGSIAFNTQDVDFSYECNSDMPYISKTFPDTDIAFNGKFILNVMSIFKDKNVKMYSEGKHTQAGIFTNEKDSVLLMPLMLND